MLDIEFGAKRKAMKKEGQRFDEEACEEYAEQKLKERMETIRSEMESVPGGRLDACAAVSQGMPLSFTKSGAEIECTDLIDRRRRLEHRRAQQNHLTMLRHGQSSSPLHSSPDLPYRSQD